MQNNNNITNELTDIRVHLWIDGIEENISIELNLINDLKFMDISDITEEIMWTNMMNLSSCKRASYIELQIKKSADRIINKYGKTIIYLFKSSKGIIYIECLDKEKNVLEKYSSCGISMEDDDKSYSVIEHKPLKDVVVVTMKKGLWRHYGE